MASFKLVSTAVFSVFLAACSSSSDTKTSGLNPDSSLANANIPEKYRDAISEAKTLDLDAMVDEGEILTLNDQKGGRYNLSHLPDGQVKVAIRIDYKTASGMPVVAIGSLLAYQQPYSIITGRTWTWDTGGEYVINIFTRALDEGAAGLSTPAAAFAPLIASNAIFDYKGKAFNGIEEGILNYTMNFGTKEGSGTITGLHFSGDITLNPAKLNSEWVIKGKADLRHRYHLDDSYELSFFGPDAEEIAGLIYNEDRMGDNEIIFAGARDK